MTEADGQWRVGDLAREAGITVRTLHHYDRLGLLKPSSHTDGGHRCYTDDDVRRLHRIVTLRSFGFSLKEIAALLDAEPESDPADLIRRHLTVVDERIRQAAALRSRLSDVLDALDRTVQPSTRQFLQLIEETATMTEPLTPEQVATLIENRRTQMEQLGAEEFAALAARREHHVAALSPQEKDQLNNRQRAVTRPTGDPQA